MRILVFGKSGQIATELQRQSDVIALGRDVMDFTDQEEFTDLLDRYSADVVINAAAYTDIEGAEDNAEVAMQINAIAPAALARAAASQRIPLIHISSDYVFDGRGSNRWTTTDIPNPLNSYGRSKLKGELGIAGTGGNFAIVRTSWVFSSTGKNFVKTMLRLDQSLEIVKVVNDQIGGPTAASDIAHTLLKIADSLFHKRGESGLYHYCGIPDTSWADFARYVLSFAGRKLRVIDTTSAEYPSKAIRPLNSRLDCSRIKDVFGISQPNWKHSLKQVIGELEDQGL